MQLSKKPGRWTNHGYGPIHGLNSRKGCYPFEGFLRIPVLVDIPLKFDGLSRYGLKESKMTGWWFGTFGIIFHNIWDVILPIDFHIFQDGFLTTNQMIHYSLLMGQRNPAPNGWFVHPIDGINHLSG